MKIALLKPTLMVIIVASLSFSSVFAYDNIDAVTSSTPAASIVTPPVSESKPKVAEFTLESLKKYNGKNGTKMLVAVSNVVYDVTKVDVFKTGSYKSMKAGTDITSQLAKLKNGKDILKKAVKVGVLVKAEKKGQPVVTTDKPKTNTTVNTPPKTKTDTKTTAPATQGLVLTLEELSKYNGENGQPAYIAVDGIIYDVTNVPIWKGGIHQGKYHAGNDLSTAILESPHGKEMLKQVPIVGKLK